MPSCRFRAGARLARGLSICTEASRTPSFFCSSTPTLFNSGTLHSQLSSCYLYYVDDTIESIMLRGIADLAGSIDSLSGADWATLGGLVEEQLRHRIVMRNAQYFKTELARKLEVLIKLGVLYFIYHGFLTALLARFVG